MVANAVRADAGGELVDVAAQARAQIAAHLVPVTLAWRKAASVQVNLMTELRYREKAMGTTWSARQDMRIRYTAPADADVQPASVTRLDLYRDL